MDFGVGDFVAFKSKVYAAPYAPFYDEYKGHEFKVVATHYERTHLELTCIDDPTLKVKGYVHPDEVEPAC